MLHLVAWFLNLTVGNLGQRSCFHHGKNGSTQIFVCETVGKGVFTGGPTVGANVLVFKMGVVIPIRI